MPKDKQDPSIESATDPVMVGGLKEGDHFTITMWTAADGAKHKNYECSKCAYATLFPDKILKHWTEQRRHRHAWGKENASPQEQAKGHADLTY